MRKRLGSEGGREYVETVPTEGYRLSVEVRVAAAPAAAEPARDADDLQSENLRRKGFHYLAKCSEEGFDIAIESFEQLIVNHPLDIASHLGRFEAHTWSTIFNYNRLPAAKALEKARESARAADELAPSSVAAHVASAISSMCYERNWDWAWKELPAAIRLDPKLAAAHLGLALWHVSQGDAAAAKREIDRAHELDELSRLMNVTRGYRSRGDHQEAPVLAQVACLGLFNSAPLRRPEDSEGQRQSPAPLRSVSDNISPSTLASNRTNCCASKNTDFWIKIFIILNSPIHY